MVTLNPQFVVDDKQAKTGVLLSVADWDHIVEALEELDDLRAYDEAKASPSEVVPFDQAVKEWDSARVR